MTIDIKELLAKILKRQTFKYVTKTSASTSFPGNTGTWITIEPTLTGNQKIIGLAGWYLTGIASTYLYNFRLTADKDGAQVAIYNPTSSAKTGTVTVDFLVVEE